MICYQNETVFLLDAQISIILLILLRSPKNCPKNKHNSKYYKMLRYVDKDVIIVGGQGFVRMTESESLPVSIFSQDRISLVIDR